MAQVIEVRLLNPKNNEVLADEFTNASTHYEAIDLALSAWSGGAGVLLEIEQEVEEYFVTGATPHWRSSYLCRLEDPQGDEGLLCRAVLFAQYKEKK